MCSGNLPQSLRARIKGLLIRRQRHRVLSRPLDLREAMQSVVAAAFLPRRGFGFPSRVQLLHEVRLVVVRRELTLQMGGSWRERIPVAVLEPRYERHEALVYWEEGARRRTGDLALPLGHPAPALFLADLPLCRAALDADRLAELRSHEMARLSRQPVLPRLLLAFPKKMAVVPEPSPAVIARAEGRRVHWAEAWGQLREAWRVPEHLVPEGLKLLPALLVPGMAHRSVAEYMNLGGLIGQHSFNPVRDGGLPLRFSQRQLAAALRARLAPDLSLACDDEDLLRAAQDPRKPLVVTRLPKVQVWLPRGVGPNPTATIHASCGERRDTRPRRCRHGINPRRRKRSDGRWAWPAREAAPTNSELAVPDSEGAFSFAMAVCLRWESKPTQNSSVVSTGVREVVVEPVLSDPCVASRLREDRSRRHLQGELVEPSLVFHIRCACSFGF